MRSQTRGLWDPSTKPATVNREHILRRGLAARITLRGRRSRKQMTITTDTSFRLARRCEAIAVNKYPRNLSRFEA